MNTYLIPIANKKSSTVFIKNIKGNSISEATDKLINYFIDKYSFIDYAEDLEELRKALSSESIVLGELYDIEEF